MNSLYDALPPDMRTSVDAMLKHAATALWPERRAALDRFRQGVARSDPEQVREVLTTLGAEIPADQNPAEVLFRIVLTAYLQGLEEGEVTNPDQAYLYGLSLDGKHRESTRHWLVDHPEYIKS